MRTNHRLIVATAVSALTLVGVTHGHGERRRTWSASDADPTAFWLNGPSCAIG